MYLEIFLLCPPNFFSFHFASFRRYTRKNISSMFYLFKNWLQMEMQTLHAVSQQDLLTNVGGRLNTLYKYFFCTQTMKFLRLVQQIYKDFLYFQVELISSTIVESVAITINSETFQHFTIFVIELLLGNTALYKPCSKFEVHQHPTRKIFTIYFLLKLNVQGYFKVPRAIFLCNDGDGHQGQFIYIKDERDGQEYLGLCEVEVFEKQSMYIILYIVSITFHFFFIWILFQISFKGTKKCF